MSLPGDEELNNEEDFEWELCKENIIPTRKGRDVKETNEVLRSMLRGDHHEKMLRERIKWEMKLRLPSEDPLQDHCDYIEWIDAHYPQCGKDSGMQEALEACVRRFLNSPEYKNDLRYVDVWIQFIKHVTREEVMFFKYLFLSGIGTMIARFYYEWALHLEVSKKLSLAVEVYEHGILAGAVPKDWLKRLYEIFLLRHPDLTPNTQGINHLLNAMDEERPLGDTTAEEVERRRQALSSLRLTGAENADVPVVRTAKSGAPGTYKQKPQKASVSSSDGKNVIVPPPMVVFKDTPSRVPPTSSLATASKGVMKLETMTRVIDNLAQVKIQKRENVERPKPWSETATFAQKCPPPAPSEPRFTIFCDEKPSTSNSSGAATPSAGTFVRLDKVGARLGSSSKPSGGLHLRKPVVDTDYVAAQRESTARILNLVRQREDGEQKKDLFLPSLPEPVAPGTRFMCNLQALYGGSIEVSWEMVRASAWCKKNGMDFPF